MDELTTQIGAQWLIDLFTFFADDAFAAWNITSVQELRQALQAVQKLIEIFNSHGMTVTISPAKTAILLELKGLDVHKALKPYL